MLKQIVANKIMTPDGTILQSYHRHDYKTYIDKNGLEYMVDGGLTYLRRNVHDTFPYTELSLTIDSDFLLIRKEFHWGTRGVDGKQPLTWVPLCDLTTEHIGAIIFDVKLPQWLDDLFEKELEYRENNVLTS